MRDWLFSSLKQGAVRHPMAALAVAACVASAAALAPMSAWAQGLFINRFEERPLGERGHAQAIAGAGGIHPNTAFGEYVSSLGLRVARTSARYPDQFVFSFVNDGDVNAFARMGGFIYVNAGIIPWMNDEAEFAALLGHEVGHATGRHAAHTINRTSLANRVIDLSERAGRSQEVVEDRRVRASLMILAYGRELEFESDDAAFAAVQALGMDDRAPARMLRQLVLLDGVARSLLGADAPNRPVQLRSHPPGTDRVRRSADLAQQRGAATRGPNGRDAFLDRINGLTIPASALTGGRATRLRVVTVQPGETAQILAQRMIAPERIRLQYFLAINGYTDPAEIRPGMRVKILGQ